MIAKKSLVPYLFAWSTNACRKGRFATVSYKKKKSFLADCCKHFVTFLICFVPFNTLLVYTF